MNTKRVPLIAFVFSTCMIAAQMCYGAQDLQLEGFAQVKAGNFNKALECFNAALKEHPDSWVIMQSAANCQMELRHYDSAVAYLQKSIETGGLHTSQCNNMAAVYQRSGQAKKALAWLELQCSLDPSTLTDTAIQSNIHKLKDPANNPSGSLTSPDYLSSLLSFERWPKEAMPLRVYVRRNIQIPDFYPVFSVIVRESLDQWVEATGHAISYKFVQTSDLADLILDYTDREELVESNHELGALGVTERLIRMKDETTYRATTVILVKAAPGVPIFKDRVLIKQCCLHELGHALAMGGHSPNPHDIMFTSGSPVNGAQLTERDKNTMRKIY
jgi:tetratricopeptide (TPR) repeat protein